MMNKIAVIGTAGVPARYGGFETLAHNLVGQLSKKYELHVYCSTDGYAKEERSAEFNGAKLHYVPFKANGIQSIIYDVISIFHALKYANTLLILGVPGCALLPLVRLFTGKRIIVNIDGLEWKRDKWNGAAKAFLRFSEFMAVKFAHTIVADNKAIQEHVYSSYSSPSKLIAYGADHAKNEVLTRADLTKYKFLRYSYAFKVCRIEPENNIRMVLKAFSEMPSKHIVIVGNWSTSEYGEETRSLYKAFPNIHLLDPIYDQKTLDSLRSNCYVYLHGHSAGGTNPSLVEAMTLGLPIIAYGVNYNRYTTDEKAMYFENSDEIKRLVITTPFLKYVEVGDAMQRIARTRYTWKVVAEQYAQCFDLAMSSSREATSKRMKTSRTITGSALSPAA